MYLEVGDIINIIGILINLICVILIAVFFQNIQVNSRTLKDYYIKEFDDKIKEVSIFLLDIEANTLNPKDVVAKFINHIASLNNLSLILSKQYKINIDHFLQGLVVLQRIIEDDVNFANNFAINSETSLLPETQNDIKSYRIEELESEIYTIVNSINNHKTNIFKALL